MASWENDPVAGPSGAPWEQDEAAPVHFDTVTPIPLSPHELQQGRAATVAQGLTLGYGDELSGGMAGLSALLRGENVGQAYTTERDKMRDAASRYAGENPWSAVGNTAIGGLPYTLLGGGVNAPTMLGRAGQTAAMSGGLGAVAGFGSGEGDFGSRALNAVAVGLPSAAIGAVSVPVLEAGMALGGMLRDGVTALSRAHSAAPAAQAARAAIASERADDVLLNAFERDSLTPENVQDVLGQFKGKPLSIADAAGNATARKARLMNTLEGEGSDTMSTFLANRQADQHGRVADDIASNLGQGGDIYTMSKRLDQSRSAAARPLYAEAYEANPSVTSDTIEEILKTPAGARAYDQARVKMANKRAAAGDPGRAEFDNPVAPTKEGAAPKGRAKAERLRDLGQAIRKLGGIKLNDSKGYITREGGEAKVAIEAGGYRGLVNNKTGKSPDYIREALREDGWFGVRDDQGADIDEFYEALRRGKDYRHPQDSGGGPGEMSAAKIWEANERAIDDLRFRANELGIKYQRDWDASDLNDAIMERESMMDIGPADVPDSLPEGPGRMVPGLKLQTLDYVKQALDDMIGVAKKAGERGEVSDLTALKKDLVGEVDRLDTTGAYRRARAAYSGPSGSMDALEEGGRFLEMSPSEIADTLKGYGAGDQDFFRVGAAQNLQKMVRDADDNADAVRRIFGNKTKRDAIEAAFGKERAARMAEAMNAEKVMTGTNRFVTGNSTTANKAADIADAALPGRDVADDVISGLASGGIRGAIVKPSMNYARGAIASYFEGMPPDVRAILAQRLSATGEDADAVLQQLIARAARRGQAGPRNVGSNNGAAAVGLGLRGSIVPPPNSP